MSGENRPRPHPLRPLPRWLLPACLGALLLMLVAIPSNDWRAIRKLPPPPPVETLRVPEANLARLAAITQWIAQQGYTWRAGTTSLAHLTAEQFAGMLGARPPADEPSLLPVAMSALPSAGDGADLPARWDWREHAGVTEPRDQGTCGSCWAFAAAGALESALLVYDAEATDLSEQQVIDCNPEGYDCDGGWMTAAYRLWRDNGAVREEEIPYSGSESEPCRQELFTPTASVDDWTSVAQTRELLKRRVLVRPIAVAMHVYPDFQYYQGGVYEHPGTDPVNHALLLIGWDDALSAWIVKNSWSTGWGEAGYAYIHYDCCRLGSYAHAITVPVISPLRIHHTPLADTLGTGPFDIEAIVTALQAPLQAGGVVLHLDTGAGFTANAMTRLGGDAYEGTFTAELPALQVGTRVRYYLSARDESGHAMTLPGEGATAPFEFRTLRRIHHDELESAGAWQAGDPGDDATAGIWEWGVPHLATGPSGLIAQPGADHTPSGDCCFVTGLAAPAGGNDVDGGRTTLVSPPFDLSGLADATLRVWYWFSNHTGPYPWEDRFTVLASPDDGATWVTLYQETIGAEGWRRLTVPLETALPLTGAVRFAFVANDTLNDSCVEALIDDLEIVTATRTETAVDGEPRPPEGPLSLSIGPNPCRASAALSFTLPRDAYTEIAIVDPTGRRVRRLWSGELPAGAHRLEWDGRDEAGTPVGSGKYWARVVAGELGEAVRPILLLR
jgi:hypothetical protein